MRMKENLGLKVLAFLLAVAAFTGAALMAWYQAANFDVIWGDSATADGYTIEYLERQDYYSIKYLLSLYNLETQGTVLGIYEEQDKAELENRLSADQTNLRWQARDRAGTIRYGNTREDIPVPAEGFSLNSFSGREPGGAAETLDVTLWLADGYPVADKYQKAYAVLSGWQAKRELLLAADIACAVAGLLLAAYLCTGAGHKRGVEGIWLHWFHRIPGDLLLAVIALGVVLAVCVLVEELIYSYTYIPMYGQLLGIGTLAACTATLVLAWLVTFAARCKARTLFQNTVIWRACRLLWRICRWCVRGIGSACAAMPLIWQVLVVGLAYLLFSALALDPDRISGLWLLVTAALIAYLCLWAFQWKRIRRGAREIIGGHPEYQIDTRWMLPGLKAHADALNNLGQAVSAAVDEQMKSERFKAELITNVSHDLKTPLTSIINYVDLLKKADVSDPKAREYIEVLDRKSQRLKKLTEDLVEASKASTGALTVSKERLDVTQLVRQAMGEYEEKLAAAGLTLVATLPETPVYISADGRHLWRVLDNLLGNCAKYAQEGTRVYLDVAYGKENAVITLKNISRQALNIPAEQLMERFVRGDESRTTEGSGLGLSIARSLTELQDGRFSLAIDGDLFKAFVVFPLA